jgi:hypothetical protein
MAKNYINLRGFKSIIISFLEDELIDLMLDSGFLTQSDLMEHLKECHDKVKK